MRVIVNEGGSVDWRDRLYLPGEPIDLPEKEAQRLIGKGVVSSVDDSGVIAKSPDPKSMKVAELKALLEALRIEYPADAKRDDLVELVMKNTAEPPKEN